MSIRSTAVTHLVVLLLAGVALHPASAQEKPALQVDRLENSTNVEWLNALCDSVTESVSVTLRLSGQFLVSTDGHGTAAGDDLNQRAFERGYSGIIFGSCGAIEEGYKIVVSAFDASQGAVTYSVETEITSVLDSFGAAESIAEDIIEGYAGITLVFGEIELVTPESGEPFRINFNDVIFDHTRGVIDRIPIGRHEIDLIQNRPLGEFRMTNTIEVSEDQTTMITPSLPLLTPEESQILSHGRDRVYEAVLEQNVPEESEIGDVLALLESEFFQSYRRNVVAEFERTLDAARDREVATPLDNPAGFRRRLADLPNVDARAAESLQINSAVMHESLRSPEEYRDAGALPFARAEIQLDGSADDWDAFPVLEDRSGDGRLPRRGSDLVRAALAYDADSIYVMFESADQQYVLDSLVHKIHFRSPSGGRLFIDLWIANDPDDQVYAGVRDPDGSDGESVGTLERVVQFSQEDVLEVAIPIAGLFDWEWFAPTMDVWIGVDYATPTRHQNLDNVPITGFLPVPVREAFSANEGEN